MVFEAECLVGGVVAFLAAELVYVGRLHEPWWGLCCGYISVGVLCCHGGEFVVWGPGFWFHFLCRVAFVEHHWYQDCQCVCVVVLCGYRGGLGCVGVSDELFIVFGDILQILLLGDSSCDKVVDGMTVFLHIICLRYCIGICQLVLCRFFLFWFPGQRLVPVLLGWRPAAGFCTAPLLWPLLLSGSAEAPFAPQMFVSALALLSLV